MSNTFNNLIQSFAQAYQLPAAELAISQEITVNGVAVSLHYEGVDDSGDVVFYAVLGLPSQGDEANAYRAVLQANHLWSGTGGATAGLMDDGQITLCYRSPLDLMTAESLANTLDLFSEQAAQWRELIQTPQAMAEISAS